MSKNTYHGMTILEVLIAIAVFSMVIAGMTVFFSKIWTLQKHAMNVGTSSTMAYRGVHSVAAVVRTVRQSDAGAYPLVAASENQFTFYSDSDHDGHVEKVCYELLSTGELEQSVIEPSGAPATYGDCTSGTSRIVARNIVNNTEAVFSYFDGSHTLLPQPIVDINQIRLVQVLLMVNDQESRIPQPITVQSQAALRNIRDFDH